MPPGHSTEGLVAALTIRHEFPETGIVVLSAFVHAEHAVELLSSGQGIGYLLKDRVEDVTEFVQSLQRVAGGGAVIDPALVQELVRTRRGHDPLDMLSAREREVLALMAEGRSNAGIARQIWIAEATVEKHVHSILGKLDLPDSTGDHRRVLAVLAYLSSPGT
jgi:DNA-binding NarL/FixJ family response regulator